MSLLWPIYTGGLHISEQKRRHFWEPVVFKSLF
nr:MAG TPA: hypothetical protein [Caudoviricetes sp.]